MALHNLAQRGKTPETSYLRREQPCSLCHTLTERLQALKLLQPHTDTDRWSKHNNCRSMASSKLCLLAALCSLVILSTFIGSTQSGEPFSYYWCFYVDPCHLLLYLIEHEVFACLKAVRNSPLIEFYLLFILYFCWQFLCVCVCLCSKLLPDVHQASGAMQTAAGLHHPDHQHFLWHQRHHVSSQFDLMSGVRCCKLVWKW